MIPPASISLLTSSIIAPEDIGDIIEEVNNEMPAGGIMFKELVADAAWSMTGERPNKNTDWSDMK